MKNIKPLAALLAAALILSMMGGCSSQPGSGSSSPGSGNAADINYSTADYDHVKTEDLDSGWSEASSTIITLNGDSASVSGSGATADGSAITITASGTYVLSGTLTDGQVIIEAPDDALVRLVLNGVNIHCGDSAPINCITADKLVLILADGTENIISDGESYTFPDAETDEPSAAVFSKQDLTINGTGSLTVTAGYNNGIGTKDDLILVSGSIEVTAANNAIRGRDSVIVIDALLTLTAGNDGIQSNNPDGEDKGWIFLYGGSYSITADHDGIQAETTLTVSGGDFDITTGGGSANAPKRQETGPGGGMGNGRPDGGAMTPPQDGTMPNMPDMSEMPAMPEMPADMAPDTPTADTTTEDNTTDDTTSTSCKALKAVGDIIITGGSFNIDSADDAVHTNSNATISGGSFTISTGDDAFHADSDLLIEGDPVINITTCYEGLEGNNVTVDGGDITVYATDDGVNAAGGSSGGESIGGGFGADRFTGGGDYLITVSGGTLRITALYDGLDSNGDILISGGEVYVSSPRSGGDGAIDCDGTVTVTGGTMAAAGGSAFAVMGAGGSSINATGTQPLLNFQFSATQPAGTVIELKDSDGNLLISYTADQAFQAVGLTSPQMQDGESYTVFADGNEIYTVTLSGTMTSISETGADVSTNMGGGMGMGGGRGQGGPGA